MIKSSLCQRGEILFDTHFAVVSIVLLLAFVSLVLLFSQAEYSGNAVFTLKRCSLPDGFEQNFASKNACIFAVNDLCSESCPFKLYGCIYAGKRKCENVGKTQV